LGPKTVSFAGEPVLAAGGRLTAVPRPAMAIASRDQRAILPVMQLAGPAKRSMTQDDKTKGSSRQDRLKLALRENLKRRKSQARRRNEAPAASSADGKASLDDAGNEASE
jgi:hypothetical protein